MPAEEIRRLDEASAFPHAAFDALAAAGYMALPYDPAYGGMGGSRKDLVVLVEALARHYSGASSLYLPTVVYGGMHLQLTAGEHLRRRYLPEICAGRLKSAFALSEPDTEHQPRNPAALRRLSHRRVELAHRSKRGRGEQRERRPPGLLRRAVDDRSRERTLRG